MSRWVVYQTEEQLPMNANQKEILLTTSSQETQPILATPTAYHSLVSPNAGPTRPRLGLHPITLPSAIISDHGSLFTSWLWANLMYSFHIEQRLSKGFHPQTDGQTERQNSVLEQYLRSYVNHQPDYWAPHLALTEFAYDAAVHFSTVKAQFEIVYGEIPRSDMLTLYPV